MSLFSQLSPHFWLLFAIAVAIAVLRELRRPPDGPGWSHKKRERP
ncbi:hypothetical protein ACIGKL_21155 [Pseudomonas sp. NPDC077186]